MGNAQSIEKIREKFKASHFPRNIVSNGIPIFTAQLTLGGIEVDNLGVHGFLHWTIFHEAVRLMEKNGGRAKIGKATGARLGDADLPLDSLEGHIAHTVFDRRLGDGVVSRAFPVTAILIWSGMCQKDGDYLCLLD